LDLETPLQFIKGIGPARAEKLRAKGLSTVEHLLFYLPFRYEDRTNVKAISELVPGEKAVVMARVESARLARLPGLGRPQMLDVIFSDGTPARLLARWFHGERLANTVVPGAHLALFGKIEMMDRSRMFTMIQPEIEVLNPDDEEGEALHTGRIVGIYEAAGNVSTRVFRVLLDRLLSQVETLPDDPLPPSVLKRHEFPSLPDAIRQAHAPPADVRLQLLNDFRSPAQTRLIFDEFFWMECGLYLKKKKTRTASGIAFQVTGRAREQIKHMLPFKPTAAQRRVTQEIADDMKQPHPMHRLLQGDVGSGKTIVAAQAAVIAMENGYQVAVLAPTEILAAQHYFYFKRLFDQLGYPVVLLTGSATAREKTQIKKLIAGGMARMVIGTHAINQEGVDFSKLGLAIVDEQHRFGVLERLKLFEKGSKPDVLVMTATPIPRTLALTLYGDLDVSVIDELPPGRKQVRTKHVLDHAIEPVYSFLAQQVGAGRQAYVVYPVIEETETASLKAAEKMYQHLSQTVFPQIPVDLLHGRLPAAEKEQAMRRFARNETKILVSTSVIEVGVDVPNASVMLIEDADRFGLAQLHQLRGRVGRGPDQSYCILVTRKLNDVARERIRTMVDSSDGFHIAEMDMKLRGPGEFFGTRQSGIPGLRIANLLRDADILEEARQAAREFIEQPQDTEELQRAVRYIQEHWQRRYGFIQVG
jgi:ATP-dependent DNA helicase RecG